MEMRPIAHIETDPPQKFGIPRNSFLAPHLQGRIVFEPEFALPQAVDGLEEFSHLWLLWEFENGMPGGTAADIAWDAAGPAGRITAGGRYVVYERGLLRSRATALEGGPSCGSSDNLGEALGMLDVVLEFGLQGFVHDSERNEVLDPLETEGWVRL